MRAIFLALTLGLLANGAQSATTSSVGAGLSCKSGPLSKTFGNSSWLVFGCDDNRTAVVVAAPGNPASPFYFTLSVGNDGYRLTGEGTGNRRATDPAYRELHALSPQQVLDLITQTKR
jgi:hypothetical protein